MGLMSLYIKDRGSKKVDFGKMWEKVIIVNGYYRLKAAYKPILKANPNFYYDEIRK